MTKYYLTTPFCETFTSREEAAGMIADAITDSDAARTAYDVFCAGNEYYYADDDAGFDEWATYEAYDLLDKAERRGRSAAYDVTVYADAETEALEERITNMIDPWCDGECRVATFYALYNVTDMVSDIIEYIVNELGNPESFDEAAARVRLIDDIRTYRKTRREKVSA